MIKFTQYVCHHMEIPTAGTSLAPPMLNGKTDDPEKNGMPNKAGIEAEK